MSWIFQLPVKIVNKSMDQTMRTNKLDVTVEQFINSDHDNGDKCLLLPLNLGLSNLYDIQIVPYLSISLSLG